MNKILRRTTLLVIVFWLVAICAAVAAPRPTSLNNIRFSQTPEKVRIVLDLSDTVQPTVTMLSDPSRLVVDLPGTVNMSRLSQITVNDQFVKGVRLGAFKPGMVRLVVDLKLHPEYKVFTLQSPSRLVIDIIKLYDQKLTSDVVPGIKYTSWRRSTANGPVAAHILDIAPDAGYQLRPVLSNSAVTGLAPLLPMAEDVQAVAAVNGSYFALNGEILGLLKLDGQIVSTTTLARTAVGILPGGKVLIDLVDYTGLVTLPDGRKIAISGVNHERGADELMLYNDYFGPSTATNSFGVDYVVVGNKITAINRSGNTPLTPDSIVLSAHGNAAKALEGLRVGDTVAITQTLGKAWDETKYALGAGPRLIKAGSVFLTTKLEEFGSDVAGGRAPRTALGLTKTGHILLVVVDGRQAASIGQSLLELALFLQELGAVDAMNLDGGGSSEMVINNKVVNSPSDGRERRVGSALAVVRAPVAN